MTKKHILFIPFDAIALQEMMPTAKKILADSNYVPLFYLCWSIFPMEVQFFKEEHFRQLDEAGMEIYDRESTMPRYRQIKETLYITIKRAIRDKIMPTTIWGIMANTKKFLQMQNRIKKLFNEKDVAAVVLISDRVLGWEAVAVKLANKRRIPTFIVPFSLYSPRGDVKNRMIKENFEQFFVGRSFQKIVSKILFPRIIHNYEGRDIFFFPFQAAVSGWVLGLLPENPWTIGGGRASRMAVENEFFRNILIEQGVTPSKMVVTGKPSSDYIYETLKQGDPDVIRGELGIAGDKKILLCAVPQLAEHELTSWERHWWEIEFLLYTFSKLPNVATVLSLHPRSHPPDYTPVAERYGAVIARRRIYELLPISDVFVATYSTTVMFAVGMAKPTVVVDFYGLDHDIYNRAPGVMIVNRRDQLGPSLKKLFMDDIYYDSLAASQKKSAGQWLVLDGKCTERVVGEIYALIEDRFTT
ncbi:MAG: CDP-glycerol glycerophosphotransferase family protein [Deltaproteobacteria bacterium]|uniref:CDP-glycerol glycerophosphotransferase family protein n=1 Tax=Candidatus Zymogenus saltonus TaxID=2844893 RepID=A0A9D8KEP1_9DELT|nr:CDP-glycerol glycerophosphotransferase family protein [Candidatus Zymogenus saltonus]